MGNKSKGGATVRRVEQVNIAGQQFNVDITELDLSGRDLSSLAGIERLTNLVELNLNDNQFTEFPRGILRLRNLTNLYLKGNQLSSLDGIEQLTALTVLDLDNNQFAEFPTGILQLTNLEELYFRNNRLTSVPAELVNLPELKQIYFTDNDLGSIPDEYDQFSGVVDEFDIEGNPRLNSSNVPTEIYENYFLGDGSSVDGSSEPDSESSNAVDGSSVDGSSVDGSSEPESESSNADDGSSDDGSSGPDVDEDVVSLIRRELLAIRNRNPPPVDDPVINAKRDLIRAINNRNSFEAGAIIISDVIPSYENNTNGIEGGWNNYSILMKAIDSKMWYVALLLIRSRKIQPLRYWTEGAIDSGETLNAIDLLSKHSQHPFDTDTPTQQMREFYETVKKVLIHNYYRMAGSPNVDASHNILPLVNLPVVDKIIDPHLLCMNIFTGDEMKVGLWCATHSSIRNPTYPGHKYICIIHHGNYYICEKSDISNLILNGSNIRYKCLSPPSMNNATIERQTPYFSLRSLTGIGGLVQLEHFKTLLHSSKGPTFYVIEPLEDMARARIDATISFKTLYADFYTSAAHCRIGADSDEVFEIKKVNPHLPPEQEKRPRTEDRSDSPDTKKTRKNAWTGGRKKTRQQQKKSRKQKTRQQKTRRR